jgi:hypothetical protein
LVIYKNWTEMHGQQYTKFDLSAFLYRNLHSMKCFISGSAALLHTVFGQRSSASKDKATVKENYWAWRGRKQYWTGFSYSYRRKICRKALRKRMRIIRQEGSSSSRDYNPLSPEYEARILFVFGTTAHSGPGPPHSRRTTVGKTPLDEWSACRRDLYLTRQNTTDTHAPDGIRNHNLSRRAAADLRLRPHGQWGPAMKQK